MVRRIILTFVKFHLLLLLWQLVDWIELVWLLWYGMTGLNVKLHTLLKFYNSVSQEPSYLLETGSYSRPKTGSPKIYKWFIKLALVRNRILIAIEVRNRLAEVRDVHLSERTIRKRLNANGLLARRSANVPELTR